MDNALLQQLITAQQTTIEILQQQLSRQEEPSVKPRAAAHAILPRLSKEDDIEAFIMTFERTATLEEWPPTEWASALDPLLTGVAQEAYFDLDPRKAADYGRLKTEILSQYQLTTRDRAVKFHQWTYTADQPVRAQIFALIRLTKQWLEPGKGVGHVVETLVVDKILRELPRDLKRVGGQANPLSADDIAQAVETYQSTGELLKGDKEERKDAANPVPRLNPARPPPKRLNPLRIWEKSSPTQQGRCYKCQSPDHYAPQCPRKDESMVTESSLPPPHASRFERAGSTLLVSRNSPCPRDSGSNRRTGCGSRSRLGKYGDVSRGADGDLRNTATRQSSRVLYPWRHPLLPHSESVYSHPKRKVYSQGRESTPAEGAVIDRERLSPI
uniref:CCHC-type domain-containing protein n=1 Tax=Hucho hucho TaxID=62062 RepID=A0A4W5P1N4_9TELE